MKCKVCNRPLKREPWITKEVGPVCAKKLEAQRLRDQIAENDRDLIVPYDGGDIWVRRKDPSQGTTSELITNVQRSIYRHSPTGFNFGYGGSGPADLALNICRMFTDEASADQIYQRFKWSFLGVDGSELVLNLEKIEAWIKEHTKPRAEQLTLPIIPEVGDSGYTYDKQTGTITFDKPLTPDSLAGYEIYVDGEEIAPPVSCKPYKPEDVQEKFNDIANGRD